MYHRVKVDILKFSFTKKFLHAENRIISHSDDVEMRKLEYK